MMAASDHLSPRQFGLDEALAKLGDVLASGTLPGRAPEPRPKPEAAPARRNLPVSQTGELFHGTNDARASKIEAEGFNTPVSYFTSSPELAASYAQGRVKKEGGNPVVLRADPVTGVSAEHTGYGNADLNRQAGADYMDKGPEVLVLHPHLVRGIRRMEQN